LRDRRQRNSSNFGLCEEKKKKKESAMSQDGLKNEVRGGSGS
jgi:hypothetical protein